MCKEKLKKQSKNHMWQTRISDADNEKIMNKITRPDGSLMMTKSEYLRAALLSCSVNVVDKEVEMYKAYVFAKYTNYFNQITTSIYEISEMDKVDDRLLIDFLEELIASRTQFTQELSVIRLLEKEQEKDS